MHSGSFPHWTRLATCYNPSPVRYTVPVKTCRRLHVRIKATQHHPDEGGAAIFMTAWLLDAFIQHHWNHEGDPRYIGVSRDNDGLHRRLPDLIGVNFYLDGQLQFLINFLFFHLSTLSLTHSSLEEEEQLYTTRPHGP